MKRFLLLIIGITMSICLFTGCGKTQENKYKMEYEQGEIPRYPIEKYVPGIVKNNIYVNESLHTRYTPIDGMKVLKVEDLKSEQDIGQSIRGKLPQSEYKVEFAAQLDDDPSVMIQIVSYKFTKEIPNSFKFGEAIKSQSKYKKGLWTSPERLGNVDFDGYFHLKINDIRLGWFYKHVNDYYVSVIVTAYDREEVRKMFSGFSTIVE